MAPVLFVLFTAVPLLETWLLIEVGQVIGGWQTVAWLFGIGTLGAWLGKRAGTGVLKQIGDQLRSGQSPADSLVEAGLVLVASVLLVTPGLLSDLTGILLFIPPVRRFLAPRIKARVLAWLGARGSFSAHVGPGSRSEAPKAGPRFDHPTV